MERERLGNDVAELLAIHTRPGWMWHHISTVWERSTSDPEQSQTIRICKNCGRCVQLWHKYPARKISHKVVWNLLLICMWKKWSIFKYIVSDISSTWTRLQRAKAVSDQRSYHHLRGQYSSIAEGFSYKSCSGRFYHPIKSIQLTGDGSWKVQNSS